MPTTTPHKSFFPTVYFKVVDYDNPDDYGLSMAAMELEKGKWWLHQKSRQSYISCYDSPFASDKACIDWAQTMYLANGPTVFERKFESYDNPVETMKRSELDVLTQQFLQTNQITKCPQGAKTKKAATGEAKATTPKEDPQPIDPWAVLKFKK